MVHRQELLQEIVLLGVFGTLRQQVAAHDHSISAINLAEKDPELAKVDPELFCRVADIGGDHSRLHESVTSETEYIGYEGRLCAAVWCVAHTAKGSELTIAEDHPFAP